MPSALTSWLACFGQPASNQPKTHAVKHPRHEAPRATPRERVQALNEDGQGLASSEGSGPQQAGPTVTTAGALEPLGFHSPAGARPEPLLQETKSLPLNKAADVTAGEQLAHGEDHSSSRGARASRERSSAPTQPAAERAAALRATADAAAAGAVPKLSEPGACTHVPAPAAAKTKHPASFIPEEAAAAARTELHARQAAAPAEVVYSAQQRMAQVSLEIEPQEGAGGISGTVMQDMPPTVLAAEATAAAAAAAAAAGGDGLQRKQRSKRVAEDGGGPRAADDGDSVPHADALAAVFAAAERTDAWVATTLPAGRRSTSGEVGAATEHQQPTSQRASSKRLLSKQLSSNRVSGALAAEPAPAAATAVAPAPPPVLRASASGRYQHHQQTHPLQPQRQSASGALSAAPAASAAAASAAATAGGSGSSRKALLTQGPSMRQDLLGQALTELHDILEAAPAAAPHPGAGASAGAASAAHPGTGNNNGRASENGGAAGAVSSDPRELSRAVLQVLQKMPSSRKVMDAAAVPPAHAHSADPVHKAHSSRAIASKAHSAKSMLAATPSAREFAAQPSGGGQSATVAELAAAALGEVQPADPFGTAGATTAFAAQIEVVPEEEGEQEPDVVAARAAPPPQKAATFRKTHSHTRHSDTLARGHSRSHKDMSRHVAPRPQLDTANRGLLDGEDAAAGRALVRVMKRFSEAGPEAAAQYVASGSATSSAAAAPQIKDQAAQRCFREGMLLSAALRLNSQRHQQAQPGAQGHPQQQQHKSEAQGKGQPLRKTVSTRQQ